MADATCKAIWDMHQRHHGNGKAEWIRNKEKITHIKVDCKSFKSFTANYTKSKQLKIKYFNNFVLNFQYNTHERKQTPSQDTEIIITSNITIPFQNICICIQIFTKDSAVINISRHTREKNTYKDLFVLILYYILAK